MNINYDTTTATAIIHTTTIHKQLQRQTTTGIEQTNENHKDKTGPDRQSKDDRNKLGGRGGTRSDMYSVTVSNALRVAPPKL